jgi:hypothetical protein
MRRGEVLCARRHRMARLRAMRSVARLGVLALVTVGAAGCGLVFDGTTERLRDDGTLTPVEYEKRRADILRGV